MTAVIAPLVDQKGWLVIDLVGAASTANAGLGEVANPEGCTLGITRAFLYFKTGSTGAANLDVGVGASGAKCTDIVSAMSVVEATVGGKLFFGPTAQAGETQSPTALWGVDDYLTFTGSASTVGLEAQLFVEYIRL